MITAGLQLEVLKGITCGFFPGHLQWMRTFILKLAPGSLPRDLILASCIKQARTFNIIEMEINKAVEVLQNQIQKLNAKDFDLPSWKNFTVLLLERIFGGETKKIESVQNIKYDKGSWVLRDETGYANSIEACKKLGREIIEEAILELETFGAPETSADQIDIKVIINALEDELTGTQFREIKKALLEEKQIEDKKKIIITKLKSYGADTVFAIVANILANQQVSEKLVR
jgi:hypothetical protein